MTQLLERIPVAWRAILGIVAIFGAGWTAAAMTASAMDLPARVESLEREAETIRRDQTATREALAYLTCRAMEEDAGRDPRSCRVRIRSLDDYLRELAR